MSWIIRIFLSLAVPIVAFLVARDSLSPDIERTFVALILMTAPIGLGAVWTAIRPRGGP